MKVLNLYSASISEVLVVKFITESFTECKLDVKYVNTVKSLILVVRVFKIDRILGTKLSKINRLERAIEYKTNKKSTIFEWKFGNRILSNVWKCYQVRLVLAAFAFVCNKLAIFDSNKHLLIS